MWRLLPWSALESRLVDAGLGGVGAVNSEHSADARRISDGIHPAGTIGFDGEPDRLGLHELRAGCHRSAPVDPRRGRRRTVLPAGRRARCHVLGHRERLSVRHLRRVRRPRRSNGTPGARTSCWPPRSGAGCTTDPEAVDCPARRSSNSWTRRCDAWAPTTSTSTTSTGSTIEVPVEETMQALDDVVRAGKVRYLGASSMWAWQFAKMQLAARSTDGQRSRRWRTSTTSCGGRRSGT